MATNPTIKPRRGTAAPGVGAINQNELAVDTTNKRIYIGAADGSGTLIGAAPGGSDTQVQFNDDGNLNGDSGLTYNKTTDTLTITGDLAVNGGDITSSATTLNLLNSTVTTLNLGGAATAITMGDSTTATTTIRGGTLVGNTTTQNIFNTTATTVNAFGAATTMAIGNTATAAQTVNMFTASTGASTYNFATGVNGGGITKTLNIGTGGSLGSLTNINIGTGSVGSPNITIGSSGNGYTNLISSVVYLPTTTYFGGSFVIDNQIQTTAQSMLEDASMTLYTAGYMKLGGDSEDLSVNIGDFDGFNEGTLITVDESSNTITLYAADGVFINGGNIIANSATLNLFNVNTTDTVNTFGSATTVNMGGASTNTVFAGTVEIDGTNALQFPDGTVQVTRTPDFILFDFGII